MVAFTTSRPSAAPIQGQPLDHLQPAHVSQWHDEGRGLKLEMDLVRYQNDLTELTPGHQVQLLSISGIAKNFRNGYIGTWTVGIDHDFHDIKFSAAYAATAGIHLASVYAPNSYGGASAPFAHLRNLIPQAAPSAASVPNGRSPADPTPLIKHCRQVWPKTPHAPDLGCR